MTSNIPSSHLPPTPSMSGGFTVKESSSIPDGPDFALPPAALTAPRETTTTSRKLKDRPLILPASPTSPGLLPLRHEHEHEPTPSRPGKSGTGTKRRLEDLDLPPPPTRTRKIIQMKPKDESAAKGKQGKEEKTSTSSTANSSSKKKQSSSTAGRKTARKTAHSLIERRRRSKMNEEFRTLKDMIPACRGEEMHKLAILQVCSSYLYASLHPLIANEPGWYRLRQLPGAVYSGLESPSYHDYGPATRSALADFTRWVNRDGRAGG